jgi:sulfane dehydrogenase subunit SoxC
MDLKSVITRPSLGDRLKKGEVLISGYAWSGSTKIKKVEISVNGGKTWKKADIYQENISVVRFNYIYNWKGNETIIQSRCIDNRLRIQPTREQVINKMGKNATYHFNGITSWKIKTNGEIEHIYI